MDLLPRLRGTSVTSLYGQIWNDPLGGGRMAMFIPRIDREQAAAFIKAARAQGLSFNYLVNAVCFDNAEFTRAGYRSIVEHLQWIAAAGADMVTVALPFLVPIIRDHIPGVKICVSSFARIQTAAAARYWEGLGADKLILPEILGRDFKAIRAIRQAVRCELELIANHTCLYFCPLDLHHRTMVSHGSQSGHPCGGFAPDFCKLSCQRMKLLHPDELIRSRWIRPEDAGAYENEGIDCLKIVERFRDTESLVEILDCYEQRSFTGNLALLLTLPREGAYMAPNAELADRPDLVDTETMREIAAILKEPFSPALYIDNQKLDGFLDHFKNADCVHTDCDTCGYCAQVARQALRVDEDWRQQMIARFDRVIARLTRGTIAGYTDPTASSGSRA